MIIIGFKKAAEALHHEAGEALRDRMLAEFHKITSPIITREEYGKPAVKEKIPFSVSHSGDIVICAMGAERRADLPMLRSGEEIAEGFFSCRCEPVLRNRRRYRKNIGQTFSRTDGGDCRKILLMRGASSHSQLRRSRRMLLRALDP